MGNLEKHWAQQKKEERDREQRRKLKEMSEEHWERLRAAGPISISPLVILAIVLFLALSFIYFAYGAYRARQSSRPDVETPAATPPQGQTPRNNTRRNRSK